MRRCPDCRCALEGDWERCPLCGTPTEGTPVPAPFPVAPLDFSRRRLFRVLLLVSLVAILGSLAAQLLLTRNAAGLGAARSVWLGATAAWLVVLTAVRKRRNVAKGTLYLVIILGALSVYWDYLTGWHGWALDYTVPAVSAASILAVLVTVRVLHVEVGDHIVYSGLIALLGLAPVLFVLLGWVGHPWPSLLCGALALVALVIQLLRAREILHEVAQRLHL